MGRLRHSAFHSLAGLDGECVAVVKACSNDFLLKVKMQLYFFSAVRCCSNGLGKFGNLGNNEEIQLQCFYPDVHYYRSCLSDTQHSPTLFSKIP